MTPGTAGAPADPAADTATVMELLTGGVVAQTLRALAELRIADHLAEGPLTAEEVAEREGSHPRATYRLMRAASSLGLLSYEGDHRFALTGPGRALRADVPGSLRSLVLVQTAHAHWTSLAHFPEAVRRGSNQVKKALGAEIWEYYTHPENAEEAALFARAMGDVSALVTQGAVAALDTAGVSTVVDVGGADGHFVLGLMEAEPRLHGQVLDLPHAVEGARREAGKRGLADRFSTATGDFFTEVPPADLYLLKTVLHDWDDDQCATILRNCRSAVHEGGRVLVVEMLVGEMGQPDIVTRADMAMLALTNGMERDIDEFDALFAASGWRRSATYPVGGGQFGMELTAV
ncbi:methyltransferase [Streptomyces zingiberis]|uniref:Methyltransferase n=1 Tax=Streptomyces zingiberis TaxID=2053010 RepID=A0ABX1C4Q7_9ACTN|nr:methyltransferase [Streptomyces zingiberis]NJQ03145.1 methyltransferase [Streptomyces zingiberis]